jgi:transcriptional regulator with XRE-family HTH domain
MSDVAKRVRLLREELGLTQVQFARQLGVSRLTVVQWETGRRQPRLLHLDRLQTLADLNGIRWEERLEKAV